MADKLEGSAEELLNLMDRLRRLGPQTAPPREANISVSQLALLSFSAANPGCGVRDMAEGLKLSKPSVSVGVTQLEEAGFLIRKPDPQDGRAIQLYLSPKGQELYQRTYEFRCQKFEWLLNNLTPRERSTLNTLLEKAVEKAEKDSQGETE